MLGRTAESLFWMSRQMERAETMARLAEAGFRISLTPGSGDGHREEWRSTLTSAGVLEPFLAKYGDASFEKAMFFLLFDDDNPSSVRSCLR
ncbi:MAG TPA: alpha-E domain-containing protein, partial [Propylenella sp.]|nr:alpha-E domain-containing protein [Propylenella sp.]